MSSLVIYGASYLEPLKVLAAINRQHPTWEVHGFVDDALPPGQLVAGLPVLGGAEVLPELVRAGHQFFHNCVASRKLRCKWRRKCARPPALGCH